MFVVNKPLDLTDGLLYTCRRARRSDFFEYSIITGGVRFDYDHWVRFILCFGGISVGA